jgi:hypothetical protein
MQRNQGLTLVEVLIVVGIVIVLGAIVFVNSAPMRESSRQTVCASQLKQIHAAWAIYSTDWPGMTFPNTEMAYIPNFSVIYSMVTDRQLLFCPDWSVSRRGKMASSYIWRPGVNVWQPENLGAELMRQELEVLGGMTPAIDCLDHDFNYYARQEKNVSPFVARMFVLRLLFNGSIWKGRTEHRRTS